MFLGQFYPFVVLGDRLTDEKGGGVALDIDNGVNLNV